MRRVLAAICIILGVALFVVGLQAGSLYDRLATVPLDQNTTSVSEGEGVDVLRLWAEKTAEGPVAHYDKLSGVHVKSTRKVVGIPGEVPAADRETTAVWQTGVTSEAVDVAPLTFSQEIVTFDRRTGVATGSSLDVRSAGDLDDPTKLVPVKHEGQFFKFPFGVQKQTYQFWDGDLSKAVPIEFVREENLFGTNTYVFQQDIPSTKVTDRTLPAGIFDATGADIQAQVMYANKRTLWIEPNTGVIIKGEEQLNRSLVSSVGTVYTTKGTIGYNTETVRDNADKWGSKGRLLGFIRDSLKPLGIVVGSLLVVAGVALLFVRRRPTQETRNEGVVGLERMRSRSSGVA